MISNLLVKFATRYSIVLCSIFCFYIVHGQTEYNTNGNYFYTIPAGVTEIKVECWGAGGGGSSATNNFAYTGGGGGGAYASSIVTVIPGNTYLVTVGAGGAGSTDGGSSYFNTNTVLAAGGQGCALNSTVGANGGTAAASIGTIRYAGGNGGNSIQWSTSGAGGGAAGSTEAGGNANNGTAGTGISPYGGDGGDGVTNWNTNGNPGNAAGGGGSGANKGWGINRTGGTGADGKVVISLPADVAISSPSQVVAADVYQGTAKHPLSFFEAAVTNLSTTINSIDFTTSGTYTSTDITRFQLWYNTSNDISTATQIGSDITAGLGTGSHSFGSLSQQINDGSTGYFWITADIDVATPGATISIDAISDTDVSFDFAIVTGSASAGGVQTFLQAPSIALSSSNPAVPAANIEQGTSDNIIYSFSTAISDANTQLNSIVFNTTGSYDSDDITRFKLWYNTSNDFSSASQVGSELISGLGTGSHSFSDVNLACNAGDVIYFWITVNVASFPDARNLTVSAITTSDLDYSAGIKTGTAYAGGQQTIQLLTGVLITTNYPAVSANSIPQGTTKQKIYKLKVIATGTYRTISQLIFETTGTYDASDIVNYKLWYNSVNSLVTATQIGSTITVSLGAGTHTFSGLSTTINQNNTGYFWITADISSVATTGNTIQVNAIADADITFTSGTKYVSTYNGGVQTILQNLDTDGDGVSDYYDYDDDNDGIPDNTENNPCNIVVDELFPNSDFEAGNTGFSSGYTYAAPAGDHTLYPEGLYTIVSDASSVHNHFANCTGHGNIMVINGSPNADMVVWSSGAISVTPYTDYVLTVEIASVTTSNPAQLIFNVNGENIGSQFNATGTNCDWVNAQTIWNSGSLTSATFEIVNLNLVAGGNDFAIDNISCTYRLNCDSDGDILPDKLDLDSDNDGIYDVVEAGGVDAGDGTIDGFSDADADGLSDNVDNVNSGSGGSEITSGTSLANDDIDGDDLPNTVDLESDGDFCLDVLEAGLSDPDEDGLLGNSPVTTNSNGVVTSATGYTTPDDADANSVYDFMQVVPLITTQPQNSSICLTSTTSATFTVVASNTGGTYQWQLSTDGGSTWSDIAGATATTLNLSGIDISYDYNQYRVQLSNPAYFCSPIASDEVVLRTFNGVPAQPGTITGATVVCQNVNNIEYSIVAMTTAESYTWTVPSDWMITDGIDTDTILASSGVLSGNIEVSAVNNCGTSTAQTLAVTVEDPTPSFEEPTATTVCQSADIIYKTQGGKSDYDWNITTGSLGADYSITADGTSTDSSITIRWLTAGSRTVTVNYSNGGCAGTIATKTLTVEANAVVLTQPASPAAMCAGTGSETLSITTFGTVSGYQWQVSTDGGVTWTDLTNSAPYSNVTTATLTITNPPAALDDAQYRCLVAGNCGNIASNPATLTVNSTEVISQSTAGQTICLGDFFTSISVEAVGSGLGYQWYSNTTAATTGGVSLGTANGAATDTLTPQGTVAGTTYYYCVVTGTCSSDTSAASGAFLVHPLPTVSVTASEDTICFGEHTDLTATGGVSYIWTSSPVSSLSDMNDVNISNPSYTPSSNPTSIPPIITTSFKVDVTDINSCASADSIKIVLYRIPETGSQYHIKNTWGN